MTQQNPYRILMVCTGNICRSPSAEGVLRYLIEATDLCGQIDIESAGLEGWHSGEGPSAPALKIGEKRGYDFSSLRACKFQQDDFRNFDLILAMDEGHYTRLKAMQPNASRARIRMFLEAAPQMGRRDVPDPYYGGDADYEYALDLIEAGCRGWVQQLHAR
jgi:protein-tyrosine phosphatase